MANSDYTYAQVKAGTGSYVYETPQVYADGVYTLQQRLMAIGYSCTADGYFGPITEATVENFQSTSLGLTVDGYAGKNTLTQLDKVYSNTYFTSYGLPLEASEWGVANIGAGNFENIDLMARIIFGEDPYDGTLLDRLNAVATVMRNRYNNNVGIASQSTYPNASKWARMVIGGYATVTAKNSRNPVRGKTSESSGVNPRWIRAVTLASALINATTIYVPNGYVIDKSTNTRTSTLHSFDNTYNFQVKKSSFATRIAAGGGGDYPLTLDTDYNTNPDVNVFFTAW